MADSVAPRGVLAVRSFVAWRAQGSGPAPAFDPGRTVPGSSGGWLVRPGEGFSLAVLPRNPGDAPAGTGPLPTLLLGDGAEWRADAPDRNLAGGVPVRYDAATRGITAFTSIVGLPPLFLYRGRSVLAIASDIPTLRGVAGVELAFEPVSVLELGEIGHPVGHRTLFRDLVLLPSSSRIRVDADAKVEIARGWELPPTAPLPWRDFLEAQIEAFTTGVRRVDVSRSFLSLTAGLDTRTVFATLADQGRLIPTATMSGRHRSLDARAAAALSREEGVRHHRVTFDERFTDRLPDHIRTASVLSGGLASLDQAPEVYFYDQIGSGYAARLSGNLGNQVGRGGTEGVSTRGAELGILSAELRSEARASGAGSGHWLLEELGRDARATQHFILEQEIPFTLVNNYPIGSHFAAQQTPYANRDLIETLSSRPLNEGSAPSDSMFRMRMRDLGHRFLGEPARISFQRTLVKRIGGFPARYPINWGWRAKGGVSIPGLAMGGATLVGMYARARGLDEGLLGRLGLPALHDFRDSRLWLRRHLAEFTRETLASASVRGSGIFDAAALGSLLDDHFAGRHDHYTTVTFALDVALAHEHFCAPSRRG